jgi:electron transport complex protein RnfG
MSNKESNIATEKKPFEEDNEPSSLRLISTLGIAGLLSGFVLVGAYMSSLPMIQANKAQALQEAIYLVLPGCERYVALQLNNDILVEVSTNQRASADKPIPTIYAGYNAEDKLIGFAIPSDEPGFQDVIAGIFGYEPLKKKIIGFEVLDSKETPGLGDKIIKDIAFRANFKDLGTEPEIVFVPKGGKSQPNEVEGITGATISSKTVVKLLQKGVGAWGKPIENYIAKAEK